MLRPSSFRSGVRPGGRKLNISGIKTVIVALAATATAIGSALTGVGAQVAFSPMLTWMLGLPADTAQATAMRYGLFTSGAAVISAFLYENRDGHAHTSDSSVRFLLIAGMVLFIAATLGATLAATIAMKLKRNGVTVLASQSIRRFFHTAAIGVGFFVLIQARQITSFNTGHMAHWQTLSGLVAMGIIVGALTQLLGLVSGALMVPSLYFCCGFGAHSAVILSLLVILLASVLPAWSYARKGLIVPRYGNAAVIGGIIGGCLGGMILVHAEDRVLMFLFAGVTMFFPARELARMALSHPAETLGG